MPFTYWKYFESLAIFFVMALALGSLYQWVAQSFLPPWQAILSFNLLLAFIVLMIKPQLPSVVLPGWFARLRSSTAYLLLYLPSMIIVCGVLGLALISSLISSHEPHDEVVFSHQLLSSILVVPVVEEVLFRRGFGLFFRRRMGVLWGSYLSAAFFALAHTHFSWESIVSGQIGLPLGPLLLGFIAEYLYTMGGYRLLPCIVFHAACNFSVVGFAIIDARWLEWLNFLYH